MCLATTHDRRRRPVLTPRIVAMRYCSLHLGVWASGGANEAVGEELGTRAMASKNQEKISRHYIYVYDFSQFLVFILLLSTTVFTLLILGNFFRFTVTNSSRSGCSALQATHQHRCH